MTIRYLPPRKENRSSRVEQFMRLWDTPGAPELQAQRAGRVVIKQLRSPYGNINDEGTPYPSRSCFVNRFHPDFEELIEPGVRSMLAAVAIDLDLVTYTSCEGHRYPEALRTPNNERHVGIIARSPAEAERVIATFERAASITNARHPDKAVEVAIMRHTLTDGEIVYPAIDLYVCRREGASWDAYFAEVDAVGDALAEVLVSEAGRAQDASGDPVSHQGSQQSSQ
jgi:hypothetical protein